MYKEVTGQEDEIKNTHSRGDEMSTFGTIASVIAGFILQAALYTALRFDLEDITVVIIFLVFLQQCSDSIRSNSIISIREFAFWG